MWLKNAKQISDLAHLCLQ